MGEVTEPKDVPAWATRAAKKQERLGDVRKQASSGAYRVATEQQVKKYTAAQQDVRNLKLARLEDGIRAGHVIEAGASADPALQTLQEVINEMAAASELFAEPPKLVIHLPSSYPELAKYKCLNAEVHLPGYIEMNRFSKGYFLSRPQEFKMFMAHELAHIANGDLSMESKARARLEPPNQKKEVLADRLGAIIHGNPKEYAQVTTDFLLAHTQTPELYSLTYLSANGTARMVHKWADILQSEGAVHPDGTVIRDKAMAVYRRSKEFAANMEAVHNTVRGR